jgi:PAS domain S-box-containing protein
MPIAQLATQPVPYVLANSSAASSIGTMPFQTTNNNNSNPSVASKPAAASSSFNTTVSLTLAPKVGGSSTSTGGGGAVTMEHDNDDEYEVGGFDGNADGDKKQMKRAANRRSAQLSRKRKKQFIEELKDENDELRRKEQILRSLPDLIVVFDSGGKLWFVSHSVERFLSFTASELEGASFWDRLCEDSVRLLKAAFMDSLAARRPEMDTAPLGTGVWELRLVDKDGSPKLVTLNGVVHFAGERPECVCSIRPVDIDDTESGEDEDDEVADTNKGLTTTTVSFLADKSLRKIRPQQSVIRPSNSSSIDNSKHHHQIKSSSSSNGGSINSNKKAKRSSIKGRIAVRISDSGNSSVESESGGNSSSDENMAGTSS